jgi:adenylate cyclase
MDDVFLFEGLRLDRRGGGLFREVDDGAPVPVAAGSRALDLLSILVERHGDLVSKQEIMDAVWPETEVEDVNLTVQISALRRILDQGRAEGSCIQTVAGRGYRFVGAVARHEADVPFDSEATAARKAPRLSIVVLPFGNLSSDPEQQYFADGITEDLTTDLSRIEGSFVISRNSAFTYRNKPVNSKQIGRELGVRYVLEGSVRRSGNRVRVNAELIDAESDAHLWAERFDRDTSDLFALQDEITSRIAISLNLALVDAEAVRPSEHPDAWGYILRGRAAFNRQQTRESYAEAINLYERALALDPHSIEAQRSLASALTGRALFNPSNSAAADIARAEALIGQVLASMPSNPLAHHAKGQLLRAQAQALGVQGRCEEAIREYETALAADRNLVQAIYGLGQCKLFTGSIDETIPLAEQAIRLSPRDPYIGIFYLQIGRVHLLQSRTDEAILWLEKARSANPAHPDFRVQLASAYGLKAETERAAAELAEARSLSGDPDRLSSVARLRAAGDFWAPKIRALHEATYFAGLRKAGMPEE